MQRNIELCAAALCALLVFAGSAHAVRVGVVISQANGVTYQKCLSVDRLLNGYEVLSYAGKEITWSAPGPWGHGLCAIDGRGCPAKNCFCDEENSWRFYVKQWNSPTWIVSMKSFDGGTSCEDHFCAQNGDMIGLAYGPDGAQPPALPYSSVCPAIVSSGGDDDDDDTTTTKKATTTAKATSSIARTTSTAGETTTTEEQTTTTEEDTTTTRKQTTTAPTSTEPPVTSAAPSTKPATTLPRTTTSAPPEPAATPAKEQPGIVGDVIAYSVNNSTLIVVLACLLAAAYISYGAYKKKARNKNA